MIGPIIMYCIEIRCVSLKRSIDTLVSGGQNETQ